MWAREVQGKEHKGVELREAIKATTKDFKTTLREIDDLKNTLQQKQKDTKSLQNVRMR